MGNFIHFYPRWWNVCILTMFKNTQKASKRYLASPPTIFGMHTLSHFVTISLSVHLWQTRLHFPLYLLLKSQNLPTNNFKGSSFWIETKCESTLHTLYYAFHPISDPSRMEYERNVHLNINQSSYLVVFKSKFATNIHGVY